MYCSGCGMALTPGIAVCPQCGRPIAPPVPPVPGMNFLLDSYASKIQTLGVFWLVYAGLSLLLAFVGMSFLRGIFLNHGWFHGPWGHGLWGPWFGPALMPLIWGSLLVRVGLAFAAGWGIMTRSQWGRVVALVAAFFNILHFPFGTALAIFTLVLLLGYRNNALYSQLPPRPMTF